MSRPILEVSGLSMRFGGLLAVNGVSLSVNEKQVVSMIGPKRCRQDHRVQLPDRFLQTDLGQHPPGR